MQDLTAVYTIAELNRPPSVRAAHLVKPIDQQEVWAAGVTYHRSKEARERESEGSGFYHQVYDAERPQLFFKATPSRTVGPYEPVLIRRDSEWTVPEPELVVFLNAKLRVVGHSVGNDLTARDIEGENLLYLPQAKIYRQCCAIGPTMTLAQSFHAPAAVSCIVMREGREVFRGETSTAEMKRSIDDLVKFLARDNLFPAGVVLMTGTGVVPPDNFALRDGDLIQISIEGLGILQNTVIKSGERNA